MRWAKSNAETFLEKHFLEQPEACFPPPPWRPPPAAALTSVTCLPGAVGQHLHPCGCRAGLPVAPRLFPVSSPGWEGKGVLPSWVTSGCSSKSLSLRNTHQAWLSLLTEQEAETAWHSCLLCRELYLGEHQRHQPVKNGSELTRKSGSFTRTQCSQRVCCAAPPSSPRAAR